MIKNITVNFSYNSTTNSDINPSLKYEVVADLVIRSDYSTNLYVVFVRNTCFVHVYNYPGNARTVNGLGTKDSPFELLVS